MGHQSRLVCGRREVFGVGESIAGFSLSLPCAVTESWSTGQPPASPPLFVSVTIASWFSVMEILPDQLAVEQLGHTPQ